MNVTTDLEAGTVAALAGEFPGWHVWRGRSGNRPSGWHATRDRHRKLSPADLAAGLLRTLEAPSAAALREQMEQQRVLEQAPGGATA